jgi:hypothetical protein
VSENRDCRKRVAGANVEAQGVASQGRAAPHKPLLLLVLLDRAEHGELPAAVLPLTILPAWMHMWTDLIQL